MTRTLICGTYWRFASALATHPARVVLMREELAGVRVRDLRTGDEWQITTDFFNENYRAIPPIPMNRERRQSE